MAAAHGMIAVDTNVLVRFIARDDARQAAIAGALIAERSVYISSGVLMETEWVLRANFGWSRDRINTALGDLLSLETVATDDPAMTLWTLARHAAGADLADMLHLVAAQRTEGFATFDSTLATDAGRDAPVRVETLR